MSYPEKKAIVSTLAGIAVLVAYCIYVNGKVKAGEAASDDLKFWAGSMLLFIVIGIAASIVIQIIFHILLSVSITVREQVQTGKSDNKQIERKIAVEMVEDEMNKLVELKSMRIGYIVAGFGLVAALIYARLGFPLAVMMNIMFISFCAGSLLDGISQLYFYRRGVTHG
ncbi:MAG: hypothetical protein JW817_05135 [Clostridiales bacterium]|nr:hypothetical protein [Clostridiales bacterium]